LLLPTDISKSAEARALVEKTVKAFGKLDVLVNNAAYQAPTPSLEETSDEDWEAMFATNVHGTFYVTKAAAGLHDRGGSIIIALPEWLMRGDADLTLRRMPQASDEHPAHAQDVARNTAKRTEDHAEPRRQKVHPSLFGTTIEQGEGGESGGDRHAGDEFG
jgi:hypothetical protein